MIPVEETATVTHASSNCHSEFYPTFGEMWKIGTFNVVVCGREVDDFGNLWVMDWDTGFSDILSPELLTLSSPRKLSLESLVEQFGSFARNGNADAMWFLSSLFEGINHKKSIWYYIAALRACPEKFEANREYMVSDAHEALMCVDVSKPCIEFLRDIPEMNGAEVLENEWRDAIRIAELATDTPAVPVLHDDLPQGNSDLVKPHPFDKPLFNKILKHAIAELA